MRFLSARQMIFDAYHEQRGSVMAHVAEIARMGAQIQTTERNNSDWRIVNALEAGQVISAVENQPPHLAALARYCFGPFTADQLAGDRETVHAALMQAAAGLRLPGQGQNKYPTAEAARQLHWIASAAIHHHSQATYPYNRPGLKTPRRIAAWIYDEHGVEVELRDWTRRDRQTWGRVWERLLRELDDWESQALAPVAALIQRAAA